MMSFEDTIRFIQQSHEGQTDRSGQPLLEASPAHVASIVASVFNGTEEEQIAASVGASPGTASAANLREFFGELDSYLSSLSAELQSLSEYMPKVRDGLEQIDSEMMPRGRGDAERENAYVSSFVGNDSRKGHISAITWDVQEGLLSAASGINKLLVTLSTMK